MDKKKDFFKIKIKSSNLYNNLKKLNKKDIFLSCILVILFITIFVLSNYIFQRQHLKRKFENGVMSFSNKNESTIFQIKNITFFSSCDAKNKNISSSNFTIENLYQFTDMALFISSPSTEKTLENTLNKVYIDNINFSKSPSLGTPSLYYKNIANFAKSDIISTNLINNKLDFSISTEDQANLDTPTLYNNLANPIVLSFVNENIKSDYTITDTSKPITYDGSLLKKCDVLLNSIRTNFSFDIYITNNLNQEFKCTVYIDIPLETENNSIYNGNITLKKDTNFIFYRYK